MKVTSIWLQGPFSHGLSSIDVFQVQFHWLLRGYMLPPPAPNILVEGGQTFCVHIPSYDWAWICSSLNKTGLCGFVCKFLFSMYAMIIKSTMALLCLMIRRPQRLAWWVWVCQVFLGWKYSLYPSFLFFLTLIRNPPLCSFPLARVQSHMP